jgi:hypothetical protein
MRLGAGRRGHPGSPRLGATWHRPDVERPGGRVVATDGGLTPAPPAEPRAPADRLTPPGGASKLAATSVGRAGAPEVDGMHFGAHLPLADLGQGVPAGPDLRAYVRMAVGAGYTTVAANDHLFWRRPWLDGPTALASVLGEAGGLTLATSVALPTVRHPVVLAKALSSLAVLAGGPVVAGLGPGSSAADHRAVGVPFEERWSRFDEGMRLVRALVRRVSIGTWRRRTAMQPPSPTCSPRCGSTSATISRRWNTSSMTCSDPSSDVIRTNCANNCPSVHPRTASNCSAGTPRQERAGSCCGRSATRSTSSNVSPSS